MFDDFHTPVSGVELKDTADSDLCKKFLDKFRFIYPEYRSMDRNHPSYIPTACVLKGEENDKIFCSDSFLTKKSVYVYFDNKNLLKAKPKNVLEYMENKEIWEDVDFCVFDDSLLWCICVTHNDQIKLVNPEEKF